MVILTVLLAATARRCFTATRHFALTIAARVAAGDVKSLNDNRQPGDCLCAKCKCFIADSIDLDEVDDLLRTDSGTDQAEQQAEEIGTETAITNEEVGAQP